MVNLCVTSQQVFFAVLIAATAAAPWHYGYGYPYGGFHFAATPVVAAKDAAPVAAAPLAYAAHPLAYAAHPLAYAAHAPVVTATSQKVESTHEPVEQHGYQIVY